MKNKKTIIFIICLVVILFLAIGILGIISVNKGKDAIKRGHNELEHAAEVVFAYATAKNLGYHGDLKVKASYKGAHGEKHPAYFDLQYEIDINNLNVLAGDAKGYNEDKINSKLLNFVRILRTTTKEEYLKIFKDLDVKAFNELFNTNYKTMKLNVEKKGFFSDYQFCELLLDDDKLTINDSSYKLTIGNNTIELKANTSGYSLNINNILKMNVFPDKDIDKYNIVVDGYSFYVTVSNQKMTLSTSSQSAIYNGLDLEFIYNDKQVDKTTKIEYDEIPIFRYFKGVEINLWK